MKTWVVALAMVCTLVVVRAVCGQVGAGGANPMELRNASIVGVKPLTVTTIGADGTPSVSAFTVPAGSMVVLLQFTFMPPFKPDGTYTIGPSDIVINGVGEVPQPIGTWQAQGIFSSEKSVTLKKPADWDRRKDRMVRLGFLYTVSERAAGKDAKVNIAGREFKYGMPFANSSLFFLPTDMVWANRDESYAYITGSLPQADASKPALKNPNGQLLVLRTEITFKKTLALDPQASMNVSYGHLNVVYQNPQNKLEDFGALLGFLNDKGQFVPLEAKYAFAGEPSAEKLLKRAHKFVFAAPAKFATAHLQLGTASLVSVSPNLAFKIDRVETVFDENVREPVVYDWRKAYVAGKLVPPPMGKKFLCVMTYVLPAFDSDHKGMAIETKFVKLRDAGGNIIEPYGMWQRKANFIKPADIALTQPEKWDGKPMPFNMVYIVPQDAKEFSLEVYGQHAVVPMATKTEQPKMPDCFTFTIKSSRLMDAVKLDSGVDYKNPDGKLLLVTAEWSDRGPNTVTGSDPQLIFEHEWLALGLGGDKTARCLGTYNDRDKKMFGYSKDKDGIALSTSGAAIKNFTRTDTWVFAVPADVKEFELLCDGWTMAKSRVMGR